MKNLFVEKKLIIFFSIPAQKNPNTCCRKTINKIHFQSFFIRAGKLSKLIADGLDLGPTLNLGWLRLVHTDTSQLAMISMPVASTACYDATRSAATPPKIYVFLWKSGQKPSKFDVGSRKYTLKLLYGGHNIFLGVCTPCGGYA